MRICKTLNGMEMLLLTNNQYVYLYRRGEEIAGLDQDTETLKKIVAIITSNK